MNKEITMKNIFWIISVTLLAKLFIYAPAVAQDCPPQEKLEDRFFLRSEDLGDKPGLYTVKMLNGHDVRVLTTVVQGLLTIENSETGKNEFNLEELHKFKYSIIHRKDYFEVVIITGRDPGGLDGLGVITYKIDPKDFSITYRGR